MSGTGVLNNNGNPYSSLEEVMLFFVIVSIKNVNSKQIIGVNIWHILVPICLRCRLALL